ncbi:MAG: VacB/RNase II family 3'-5' exoribonuclease [Aestuariivita sp.]|nr:VacB/RNase II family 3'-5' exoribonuclease [Aestuariivita sp.]
MNKIPTKAEILGWILAHSDDPSIRRIYKAFGVKKKNRSDVKRLFFQVKSEQQIQQSASANSVLDKLPPVCVIRIKNKSKDGRLMACPEKWSGKSVAPSILVERTRNKVVLSVGDKILVRLVAVSAKDHTYRAKLIRRIENKKSKMLAVYKNTHQGGVIVPIIKAKKRHWDVPDSASMNARDGELVQAEPIKSKYQYKQRKARIVQCLGTVNDQKSCIAIHQNDIPTQFPKIVEKEIENIISPSFDNRQNLCDLPFVTIDPENARDHDDAVYARTDPDEANPNGHEIWVAIADVAAYVTPQSAIDNEAFRRGNSIYFPDQVVPMLPEKLSGDLCSLHESKIRPCIAVKMTINNQGQKIRHRFVRGFMSSVASLNYSEVQFAIDGYPNERTKTILKDVIQPLFAAYKALKLSRKKRQPLNLDLNEHKIELSKQGHIKSVQHYERLDTHRWIEEFMILANCAAAESLISSEIATLYRVHDRPSDSSFKDLQNAMQIMGCSLPNNHVSQTSALNTVISKFAGSEKSDFVNLMILRAMSSARYSSQNTGHFGLALKAYTHFTSPIRRYSDLIVHRALITANDWGTDGLSAENCSMLEQIAQHVCETERRAMIAERETLDRYFATYLKNYLYQNLSGRISEITSFGIFIRLDLTGRDGLTPKRDLKKLNFDRESKPDKLLGEKVVVQLMDVCEFSGKLILSLKSIGNSSTESL